MIRLTNHDLVVMEVIHFVDQTMEPIILNEKVKEKNTYYVMPENRISNVTNLPIYK